MPYGVANRAGQVTLAEAVRILEHARAAGLNTLDTAISYGESESRLGEIGVRDWKVISKLPAVPADCASTRKWIRQSVQGSLERLGVEGLYGLLLHRPQQLLGAQAQQIHDELSALKAEGIVRKIGVSIYDPGELEPIVRRFPLDLVQAPLNVLDRRLVFTGWLSRLHAQGTEVHARSVFLQGLLLMHREDRPAQFRRWQHLWEAWHQWLQTQELTPVQSCLGCVMSYDEVTGVVVGVDSLAQLQEIISAEALPHAIPPSSLASEDLDLLNPSRWSAT
jgi:aryl-alcohol dehydrogenase-like predicted oxidoreductase